MYDIQDWKIESLQQEYLREKSLQKNHCWNDFLQKALLHKRLLQVEDSFRKNHCRKKITACRIPAKWQSFKNISCNKLLLRSKITAELHSCRKKSLQRVIFYGDNNSFLALKLISYLAEHSYIYEQRTQFVKYTVFSRILKLRMYNVPAGPKVHGLQAPRLLEADQLWGTKTRSGSLFRG